MPPAPDDRRRLLANLSRAAAALALGRVFATPFSGRAADAPAGDYPFTLGVASGMPRPDSVVLWTRLAPQPHAPGGGMPPKPLKLRWELADDDGFRIGVRSGTTVVQAEQAHSAHVRVEGLPSGAQFFYRFMTPDAVSPIGRTCTAPAADAAVASLRIALASCQHYEQGAFVAHREIAARDLDVVLFVGDYIYESTNPRYRLRAHEGPPPMSLDQYRARHATYKLDADLRAAHAAHPWIVTWDDHEVENDYANDRSPLGLPPAEFLRRRAAAYQAYFEHMPITPAMAPQGAAMRLHDRYTWGRLAELWTLDSRQYRDVQACGEGAGGRVVAPCEALADASRSVLGNAQERWLAQGLAASTRRWKLLGMGSQVSPTGVRGPGFERIYTDGWDGYPPARERLLRAMAQAPGGNVLSLGGDVHRHVAAQLRLRGNDSRSPIVAGEFVCSSVTSRGLSESMTALVRASNPDILHARGDERGYAFIEIDAKGATCDFRATPFPADARARLSSQAKFAVEAGVAGVAAG